MGGKYDFPGVQPYKRIYRLEGDKWKELKSQLNGPMNKLMTVPISYYEKSNWLTMDASLKQITNFTANIKSTLITPYIADSIAFHIDESNDCI